MHKYRDMNNISSKNKHNNICVHFIGVLGSSMSKLAKYTKVLGYSVSGSDVANNQTVKELENLGITVRIGHKESNVNNANVVVYSSAISNSNCELICARKTKGVKVFSRGEYLAIIARTFKNILAISGSHGKSTTTAMVDSILRETSLRPFIHTGGEMEEEQNAEISGELIVLEACEYMGNFLQLTPDISVITNVELDHTDYYKSEEELNFAFLKFARQTKRKVICDYNTYKKIKNKVKRILTVGDDNCDVKAQNLTNLGDYYKYEFWYKGVNFGEIQVNSPFIFNVKNSLFAILACLELGVSFSDCQKGICKFKGVKRRQEVIKNGIPVYISDYAHHPTQIKNVWQSLKYKKTLAIFQSHTYTRTRDFLKEFASVLEKFDHVVIMPTYAAREEFDDSGSGKTLYNEINMETKHYAKNKEEVFHILNTLQKEVETVIFLGAGDIDLLAREYCNIEIS